MRFLRLGLPEVTRVLLVESGSRHLLEGVISYFRRCYPQQVRLDLVTCYAGLPPSLEPETTTVYHIHQYRGSLGREHLYRILRARKHEALVMVCSGEPIMTKWKWALALHLPVKVLIVNENGDFFWLDRSNWPTIRRFVLDRSGLAGSGAVRTVGRVLASPLTLLFLLLYAAFVHLRRKVHT